MRDPLVCQLDAHRTMAPAPPGALFQPDDTPAWTQEHLAEVSARLSASRRGTRAHRPGAPVRGLEFSADGRRLASVGGGGDLLLWDLQPGGQGGLGLQPLGTPRQVAAALRERAWTPSAHAINTLLAFPPAGDETSTGPGGGSGTMPSRSAVLAAVGLGRARAQAPRHPAARAPAAPDARPRRRSRRAAPPPGPRGSDVPAAAVAQPAGRRATPYYAFASAPLAIIDHLEVPLVVAPSGDSIAIFNMLTGEKVRDLVGHFGQVTSVRVRSPRAGGLVELVSAGGGGRILRWVPAVGCRASNFATAEFSSPASLASRPHLALPFTPPEEMAMPAEAALPGGPAPALGPGLAAGASPAQAPHPTKPPASGGMPRPLLPAEASHAEALAAAGLHSVDIDQWSSSDED
ncbi:hypothetical protein H696_05652 [Fonticula alba]|uniref:Uncharacterized protein n=1 Tax=Fonticula alba TaxID=691883 RepID=A0A058Z1C4_FONAL|nr:hypothetical protein H696_05652 [Fonticula alba]KCV67926.1 hypothetical protein H696_05652 [Fonticula alba]|eukprot:XP_009497746.1 hypothetical protein H696_05652 [Fonticula alba]